MNENIMYKVIFCGLLLLCLFFVSCNNSIKKTSEETTSSSPETETQDRVKRKPVIYLYPEAKTEVRVTLDYDGKLTATYPEYKEGWDVVAYPDGKLVNKADAQEYSYLFWEGTNTTEYDFTKGFVVAGEDTAEFLQKTLSQIGLLPHEYNEFIVYWLPMMQENKYNLISFQGTNYTDSAKLVVNPGPDSTLRVFMAYKALDEPIDIEPQTFKPFERKGFTLVEWGGCEVH